MRSFLTCFIWGLLGLSFNIFAAPTRWSLDNFVFEDGGTATGTFVYDSESGVMYGWNISVSGGDAGVFPAFTYTAANSYFILPTFYPLTSDDDLEVDFFLWRTLENNTLDRKREIRFMPVAELTDAGGVVPIYLSTPSGWLYEPPHEECFNCAPYRTIVSGSLVGTPELCISSDPLFFHNDVNVQANGPRIDAVYAPSNGCSLDEVARAGGFDHFNWINLVVLAPLDMQLICGAGVPFLDPLPGDRITCPAGWSDDLDYYWNEVNQDGTTTNTEVEQHTTQNDIEFLDTPSWETLSENNVIRFFTSLVGVRGGNDYEILDTFRWETTFNGTAGGVRTFKNPAEPDEGSGTGAVTILEEGMDVEDFPLALRQYLDFAGVSDVPLPEPIDIDNDNITDDIDNCQSLYNEAQLDGDSDFVGDLCDNCPSTPNPEQIDSNNDGVGNACDMANAPPVADAGGPYSGTVGEIINFNGSGSYDPDNDTIAHNWDFGDGDTGTGDMPAHSYAVAGDYTVTLTVTDDGGLTDTATTSVEVVSAPASLGDLVWEDTNGDGRQDGSEPGIAEVAVDLKDAVGNVIATTVTNADGFYLFDGLAPGTYVVRFVTPSGFEITQQDVVDDTRDSDADRVTGQTVPIELSSGENDLTWDAGFIQEAPPGDLDGDGVPNNDDACPDTLGGEDVDQVGCSAMQFCNQIELGGFLDLSRRQCRRADWKNNEDRAFPLDCRIDRNRTPLKPHDDTCVSTRIAN